MCAYDRIVVTSLHVAADRAGKLEGGMGECDGTPSSRDGHNLSLLVLINYFFHVFTKLAGTQSLVGCRMLLRYVECCFAASAAASGGIT